MPNYPRLFAYVTGSSTIGMLVYIFTNIFYVHAQRPDLTGTLFLLGFGLVFFSVSSGLSRRFIRRTNAHFNFPFVIAVLLFAPTLAFAWFQDRFVSAIDFGVFSLVVILGALAGTWMGVKSGFRKRDELIAQLQKKQEEAQGNN